MVQSTSCVRENDWSGFLKDLASLLALKGETYEDEGGLVSRQCGYKCRNAAVAAVLDGGPQLITYTTVDETTSKTTSAHCVSN